MDRVEGIRKRKRADTMDDPVKTEDREPHTHDDSTDPFSAPGGPSIQWAEDVMMHDNKADQTWTFEEEVALLTLMTAMESGPHSRLTPFARCKIIDSRRPTPDDDDEFNKSAKSLHRHWDQLQKNRITKEILIEYRLPMTDILFIKRRAQDSANRATKKMRRGSYAEGIKEEELEVPIKKEDTEDRAKKEEASHRTVKDAAKEGASDLMEKGGTAVFVEEEEVEGFVKKEPVEA